MGWEETVQCVAEYGEDDLIRDVESPMLAHDIRLAASFAPYELWQELDIHGRVFGYEDIPVEEKSNVAESGQKAPIVPNEKRDRGDTGPRIDNLRKVLDVGTEHCFVDDASQSCENESFNSSNAGK
jgi:hypothetical protein